MPPHNTPNIFRLPYPDGGAESPFVMVHAKANGRKLLDLKLLATDGEGPFHGQLRHNRIEDYKANNCPLSKDEWEDALASLLLGRPWPDSPAMAGIDASVTIEQGAMTIQIRKHVQGITQRLGSIKLVLNQEVVVDVFEWCLILADSRFAAEKSLEEANAKVAKLESTIAGLTGQLERFIDTKESDEAELLEKFKTLLNEKKVKIREQQKLITAAQQTPGQLADEEGSPDVVVKDEPLADEPIPTSRKARKAPAKRTIKASGRAKRKVSQLDESDTDGEPMDVDNGAPPEAQSEDDQMTDDEDETADEVGSDDEPVPSGLAGSSSSQTMKGSQDQNRTRAGNSSASREPEAPPPRRELPFATTRSSRNAASGPVKKAAPPQGDGGDETDSDDEL